MAGIDDGIAQRSHFGCSAGFEQVAPTCGPPVRQHETQGVSRESARSGALFCLHETVASIETRHFGKKRNIYSKNEQMITVKQKCSSVLLHSNLFVLSLLLHRYLFKVFCRLGISDSNVLQLGATLFIS